MKLFSNRNRPHSKDDGGHRIVVEGGYVPDAVVVPAREPVRLVFHRHDDSPCSEEVIFPEQGVRATLGEHRDTAVDLPPSEPGEYEFHCGMGMLHGRLVVR